MEKSFRVADSVEELADQSFALISSDPLIKSDLSYTKKTGAIQTGFLANWEARISLDDIFSSVIGIDKRNPCQAPTGLIHQKYTFLT